MAAELFPVVLLPLVVVVHVRVVRVVPTCAAPAGGPEEPRDGRALAVVSGDCDDGADPVLLGLGDGVAVGGDDDCGDEGWGDEGWGDGVVEGPLTVTVVVRHTVVPPPVPPVPWLRAPVAPLAVLDVDALASVVFVAAALAASTDACADASAASALLSSTVASS